MLLALNSITIQAQDSNASALGTVTQVGGMLITPLATQNAMACISNPQAPAITGANISIDTEGLNPDQIKQNQQQAQQEQKEQQGKERKKACIMAGIMGSSLIGLYVAGAAAAETSKSTDNNVDVPTPELDEDLFPDLTTPSLDTPTFDNQIPSSDFSLDDIEAIDTDFAELQNGNLDNVTPDAFKDKIANALKLVNGVNKIAKDNKLPIDANSRNIIDKASTLGNSALSGENLSSLSDINSSLGESLSNSGISLPSGDISTSIAREPADVTDNFEGSYPQFAIDGEIISATNNKDQGNEEELLTLDLESFDANGSLVGPQNKVGLGNVNHVNGLNMKDPLTGKSLTLFQRATRRVYKSFAHKENLSRGIWMAVNELKRAQIIYVAKLKQKKTKVTSYKKDTPKNNKENPNQKRL